MLKNTLTAILLCLASGFLFSAQAQTNKSTVKKTTTIRRTTAARPVIRKKPTTLPIVKDSSHPAGTTRVKITTDSGTMVVLLYDSTPLHRDNFIKLVKEGFYDSLLFHRVIAGFMIQGGDPLSKNAQPGAMLGNGGSNMERIPAEFRPGIIHKKGALAAARDNNPAKASSACQFYIVDGKPMDDNELNMIEASKGIKYSAAQRNIYKTSGGTPFLDMDYTVFGEVLSGMDVIHKIAMAQKDMHDRPAGDIHMKMEIIL